jgi:hypothetical protein
MEKEMLKSGDNVMFIGLVAGLTWGGVRSYLKSA